MIVTAIARARVRPDNARGRTSIVGRIPQDQTRIEVRPETFPERLRRLRRARDWSQRELSARSGLGEATVSMIEQGRSAYPIAATVAALARGLGLTMDALWLGEDAS